MTSKEFVIWLKGYSDAIITTPTQAQWDTLKEKVKEVKDDAPIGFPFGVPNTAPIQTLPHITPSPTNPYRPYEVYCGDTNGTTSTPSMVVTTTPGQSSITYATPQFITSTAYGYPSGSTISYTNGKTHNED
jgi:hypothetical protein